MDLTELVHLLHVTFRNYETASSTDFAKYYHGAKVFAACNQITRLSTSRFRRLHVPPYTEDQFLEESTKVLPKLKIANVIGKAVWDM